MALSPLRNQGAYLLTKGNVLKLVLKENISTYKAFHEMWLDYITRQQRCKSFRFIWKLQWLATLICTSSPAISSLEYVFSVLYFNFSFCRWYFSSDCMFYSISPFIEMLFFSKKKILILSFFIIIFIFLFLYHSHMYNHGIIYIYIYWGLAKALFGCLWLENLLQS